MTGYSGRSVVAKLGYKPGEKVYLSGPPDWFAAHMIESNLTLVGNLPADWAHLFVSTKTELEHTLDNLKYDQIGKGIWVSWPKKSSKVRTDLTEQTFRDLILPLGWVDTKVAAIDDTWSGLKFHRRKP